MKRLDQVKVGPEEIEAARAFLDRIAPEGWQEEWTVEMVDLAASVLHAVLPKMPVQGQIVVVLDAGDGYRIQDALGDPHHALDNMDGWRARRLREAIEDGLWS